MLTSSIKWLMSLGLLVTSTGPAVDAAEPPKVVRHVVVYKEPGRFAGWPANHGIWSWGDEILVGFSRGTYKDRGRYHNIDHDRPEEFLLARSRDGGLTWSVEQPHPSGALAGTPGMRHGIMPPDYPEERPVALDDADRFFPTGLRHDAPDGELEQWRVALIITPTTAARTGGGPTRCHTSASRASWPGPTTSSTGRATACSSSPRPRPIGKEGRPFSARTTDGGRTWRFLSFIGPEPSDMRSCPRRPGSRRPTW